MHRDTAGKVWMHKELTSVGEHIPKFTQFFVKPLLSPPSAEFPGVPDELIWLRDKRKTRLWRKPTKEIPVVLLRSRPAREVNTKPWKNIQSQAV